MIANVNNQITSIVSQSVARDEGKNRWLKSSCHYRVSLKVRLRCEQVGSLDVARKKDQVESPEVLFRREVDLD